MGGDVTWVGTWQEGDVLLRANLLDCTRAGPSEVQGERERG